MEAHPVDQARWADLVELFGPSGGTRGCWCMARRLPAATVAANGSAENRAALEGFVEAGVPVGLIGYVDDRPAIWCAVAPRTEYYAILHSRTLPIDEPDDDTIWAINCLFVKSGYRGRGLTSPMVDAAVEYARSSGARIVEAYPVKAMPGDPGRGVLSTFLAAGFTTYAEGRTTAKRNVVVRRSL
ncbi:acetyltransferase (GNAT) family protein [Kribbella pratensis]|uniref:Acetyltransferase (GNAT) family protein n=1 Tax=Kribbella pratensis TaxID=2512112 RepID=A0ABY2FCP6_9ACTN|nr:GNAT family N-acetyltransferase [Kribbella pratensis]TDW88385.1 acetyltransferase (GNAT) family protein [Kribbella pratensis]